MRLRRLTRLTNAFSKKIENLDEAVALHALWYPGCRKHQTIKAAPAIAGGIADRVRTPLDIAALPE